MWLEFAGMVVTVYIMWSGLMQIMNPPGLMVIDGKLVDPHMVAYYATVIGLTVFQASVVFLLVVNLA